MKKILLPVSLVVFFPFVVFSQQLNHVLGEIIVQLRYGSDMRQISEKLTHLRGVPTNLQLKKELSPPLRIWLLEFDFSKINENEFLQKIRNIREVENAQFNHLGEYRQTIPDDPAFSQQWMWLNTGQSGGLVDADIDLDLAWDVTTGGLTADGREIVVCVVEGANRNHADLQGNLWYNLAEIEDDSIDNDGNGYVDDFNGWYVNLGNDNVVDGSNGHGTFVTGAIGAKGNNGTMVTGVNWDIKIMHVDFSGGVSEAKSIAAYTYPLIMRRKYNETGGQEGAFVVATNSSWGVDGGDPSEMPIWCAMYDSLGQEGILSCGSTTNDNVNVDLVGDMPTGCGSEYLISVTATNNEDERTFAGFGVESIDVAAPGQNFISINLNGGPSSKSGTSFASPTVAGIIGLLYSAPCSTLGAQALGAPAATANFVRDAIYLGVDFVPNLEGEVKYAGRVNAFNSLEILLANCGACPKPFGIRATQLTDVDATLEWFSTDSTLSTDMLFREAGLPNWEIFHDVSSPFHFSGLKACTNYEIRLQDICENETSGYSNSLVFETDGCCVPPSNLTLIDYDETNASFTWEAIFAANSYNLQLITSSGGAQLFEDITSTSFDISNLDTCTDYSIQLQTVCDTGFTIFSTPLDFQTFGCGNCTDLSYCRSNSINAEEEWIANVTIGNLNNTSVSNGGYGDFTDLSVDLTTYQTYSIDLSPGFSGFGYNEWFSVFIDFNQDGDFDDLDEEAFNAGGLSNQPVQGSVFIPGDAMLGSTRMRVVMKFNDEPMPCEMNFQHGEVEDYCVYIKEGVLIDCESPEMLDIFDIGLNDADFSWQSSVDAISYDARIKPTANLNWTVVSASDTFFSASNLEDCTDYQCQVRSVCAETKSAWSANTYFTTKCLSSVNQLPNGIGFWNISPNPFRENLAVHFELEYSSFVALEIIDLSGKILYELKKKLGIGEHRVNLVTNENQLSPGIYFVKIKTENGIAAKKVIRF